MQRSSKAMASPAIVLAGLVLAGCGVEPENRLGYYTAPRRDLVRVRRVAMLPLANESDHPGTETGLSEELFRAVQGCQLFHVRPLDPEAPAAAALPPVGSEPLTLADLQRLRRALGTDAVLAGAVTRWQPYPRMQTGLYLRLVDLRSGEVLWAVDHVWDATDEHTQRRIRRFFARRMGRGADPFGWELGTVSPRAFQKFVAHEVVETLPGRRPPGSQRGLARNFRKNRAP
ncbi:MAG: hypothetical protein R6X20_14375 [Phycisphaerae bacterium]